MNVNKSFSNILKEGPHAGKRIETIHGAKDPTIVLSKLRLLAENKDFKSAIDNQLNKELGMNLTDFPDMLTSVPEDELAKISSLLGDIRYNVDAANDGKYDYKDDVRKIVAIIKTS